MLFIHLVGHELLKIENIFTEVFHFTESFYSTFIKKEVSCTMYYATHFD